MSSGNFDRYVVPVITTVAGGVALALVLWWLGFAELPKPKETKESDQKTKKAANQAPDPSKLIGEWEQQASALPGQPKARMIFTEGDQVYWMAGPRMERVNYAIKGGRLELSGVGDRGQILSYKMDREGNALALDLQGVTTLSSAFARLGLGGKWRHLGEYNKPLYDRTPTALDPRVPGIWESTDKTKRVLDITLGGRLNLFKAGTKKDPLVVGDLEPISPSRTDLVVNQREIYPLRFEISTVGELEIIPSGEALGESKQLVGKWKRSK